MRTAVVRLNRTPEQVIAKEAPVSADGRETGGILLGHDRGADLQVTEAGGPGPNAERRVDGFVRDLAFSRKIADQAFARDRSVWVGEWHTHPTGLSTPSTIDVTTYRDLLADEDLGFTRVLSVIVVPCRVHGWAELRAHAWIATPSHIEMVRLILKDECVNGGRLIADGTWGGGFA